MTKLELAFAAITVCAISLWIAMDIKREKEWAGAPLSEEAFQEYLQDPTIYFEIIGNKIVVNQADPPVHREYTSAEFSELTASHDERLIYIHRQPRIYLATVLMGIALSFLLLIYWIQALNALLTKGLEPQISWLMVLFLLPPIGAVIFRFSIAKKIP